MIEKRGLVMLCFSLAAADAYAVIRVAAVGDYVFAPLKCAGMSGSLKELRLLDNVTTLICGPQRPA